MDLYLLTLPGREKSHLCHLLPGNIAFKYYQVEQVIHQVASTSFYFLSI